MDNDILKEYLVKIGVDIPMSEIQKFNKHMADFDKGVFGLIKRLNNLISGWRAVILSYTAAAKKIASFTFEIARSDLEIQKWAKHMYLTNDSAKILSRTLDAMGLQFNDLQDVALNPELYNQYKELVRLGKQLAGGQEISSALRKVREVGFEFTKLRMTLSYLGERIAYYVSKVLDSPVGKAFVNGIKNFNSFVANNLDKIAKKIATILNVIITTAMRVGQLIKGWFELIRSGYNWLESRLKGLGNVAVAIIGVIGTALLLSPIGKLLLMFQALMLVIDDYMVYKSGSDKYAFPWEKSFGDITLKLGDLLLEWTKKFWEEDLPEIASLAWEGIKDIASNTWDAIKDLASLAMDGVKDLALAIWVEIKDIADSVWSSIKDIAKSAWEGIVDIAKSAWEKIVQFLKEVWEGTKKTTKTVVEFVGGKEPTQPGGRYKAGIVESILRLPAVGLGRLILPKEEFEKLQRASPSAWDSDETPPQHTTVILNGETYTKNQIEKLLENTPGITVRANQGGFG